MAKKRKTRRKSLGSPPEVHHQKADHSFHDAAHHAGLSVGAMADGRCVAAFTDLLIANGALEEAKAHHTSNGRGETRWSKAAERAVGGAVDRFSKLCIVRR